MGMALYFWNHFVPYLIMWEKSLHSSLFYLDLCGIHFYFCHHRDWYSPVDIWMVLYFWNHFVPYLIMWDEFIFIFVIIVTGIHLWISGWHYIFGIISFHILFVLCGKSCCILDYFILIYAAWQML